MARRKHFAGSVGIDAIRSATVELEFALMSDGKQDHIIDRAKANAALATITEQLAAMKELVADSPAF